MMMQVFEGVKTSDLPVHWRGPSGFSLIFWEVDFRTGGASRVCVRSPEGRDYWVDDVYLEIVEPERVVFTGDLDLNDERPSGTARTVTFHRA
jgi:uncharacterized protein YndB with AHSA1/START domain